MAPVATQYTTNKNARQITTTLWLWHTEDVCRKERAGVGGEPDRMKIYRFRDADNNIHHAADYGDGPRLLVGDLYGDYTVTDEAVEMNKVLAPIVPRDIICIGLNYRKHAEESNMAAPERPIVFLKTANTLQNPDDPIVLPRHARSDEVDYECELAVVIGKPAKNVSRENALDYVLGYTCANDVSARDWQLRLGGGQWSRGKSFDTFTPLGPCLVTSDDIPDPNALSVKTVVSGETRQDWNTNDMIFDVPALIEFLSGSTTLLPGTLILTGTPQGVGMAAQPPRFLVPGDSVTIEIEKIGALTNPVTEEAEDA